MLCDSRFQISCALSEVTVRLIKTGRVAVQQYDISNYSPYVSVAGYEVCFLSVCFVTDSDTDWRAVLHDGT